MILHDKCQCLLFANTELILTLLLSGSHPQQMDCLAVGYSAADFRSNPQ